jgi:O-antigen/teichoic acid export membrane protein
MRASSKEPPKSADAVLAPMSVVDASVPVLPYATPKRSLGGMLTKMASRGAWAMADQAVVSIGNYATVILVARNLSNAKQVGAFSMILEVLLFLNSLQSALVIYPLLVRGAVLDKSAMQRLAAGCLIATGILCIPLSMAMLGTSVYFGGLSLLLWGPLALIFQQLQETVRRALLAHLRYAAAIPGDAISYLVQAVILVSLGHRLTLTITFAVIAITSALAALVQVLQIGPRRFPLSEFKALVADFWTLSRWVLYSNLGSLVTNLSYSWVLFLSAGLTPVGYFGVIANLAKLVNPLTTALSGLIIPSVARARAGGGTRFAMRIGAKYALLGLAALAIYFGVLFFFPKGCLSLIYGKAHPDYAEKLPGYLRVLVCSWTLLFITNMTIAILNGLGYSRVNFYATIANGIVTVLISLPLIYKLGLAGTIIGGFLATASATVVAVYCFIRHHNDAPDAPSEGSAAPAAI